MRKLLFSGFVFSLLLASSVQAAVKEFWLHNPSGISHKISIQVAPGSSESVTSLSWKDASGNWYGARCDYGYRGRYYCDNIDLGPCGEYRNNSALHIKVRYDDGDPEPQIPWFWFGGDNNCR